MSKLVSAGAFWLRDAKSGVRYMSGKVNDIDVVVFKNTKKERENQPDYNVMVDTEKYPQFIKKDAEGNVKPEYDFKRTQDNSEPSGASNSMEVESEDVNAPNLQEEIDSLPF